MKKEKITYKSDEQIEITKFAKILAIILVLIAAVYFISKNVSKNKEAEKETDTVEVDINYDKAIIGNLFNRPYDTYYAFIYDSASDEAGLYNQLLTKYNNKSDSIKTYYSDLNNGLNKKFYDKDNTNYTNDLTTLKVGDFTLLKIANGKLTKSVNSYDAAKKELGIE